MSVADPIVAPKLRLGSLTLGDVPRVAIAVRDNVDRAALDAAMAAGATIVEARIDEYQRHDIAYVKEQLERLKGLHVLATIRHKREGGGWDKPEAERLALYREILPLCSAVDAEIYSRSMFPELAAMAKAAHKLVIGSYHDFQGLPSPRKMIAINAYGRRNGAQIVKIAAMCRRKGDLTFLTRYLVSAKPNDHLVIIGMGEHGASSRIFLPLMGSLITYTFLGEATAPGQLTLDETLKYLSAFCPGFAGHNHTN